MARILGLDLGTNSIGWALVDDTEKRIVDIGVRIFPEGVNLEKGKEVSKNATRREKRQLRRQNFRRKMRKRILAKKLQEYGMFPATDTIDSAITMARFNPEISSFFQINPYECRARAYSGAKLTLMELGRVLYHFSQRRGYRENLQSGSDEEGVIFEGKDGKIGINETRQKVEEYGTLGNYLAQVDTRQERLRNRYTTRQMYINEFEEVWAKQRGHYPHILTDELKNDIGDATGGILFFQRPLRSQKHLIGKCPFEKDKPRCPDSSLDFEKVRMYQFINNIRYGDNSLDEKQRALVEEIFSSKDKFEFSLIKKKLKLLHENFNYEDEQKIVGNRTINNLRKIFGEKVWDALSPKEQEEIWHAKFSATTKDWLKAHAITKWGLNEDQAEKLAKLRLSNEYGSLSRKAIRNILPFLEQGHTYDKAVLLGGVVNAYGNPAWNLLPAKDQEGIVTEITNIIEKHPYKPIEKIKLYLKDEKGLSEKALGKLYHHSQELIEPELQAALPAPPHLRNPLVQQALFELRKLVNAILEKHGGDGEIETIRVEMARDLKLPKKKRDEIRSQQFKNEARNDRMKVVLDEYGLPHSSYNIQKLVLYYESNRTCPYSGNQIGITDLFKEYEIEHIIPYSISLDDSLANKTICERRINQSEKRNLTPYQYYQRNDPKKWEEVKARVKSLLPYKKYQKFVSEDNPALDDFIQRQLNDTRYISREAVNYLKNISRKVNVAQGTVTSLLRHYWGLNNILLSNIRNQDLPDGEYIAALDGEGALIEIIAWDERANKKNRDRLQKLGRVVEGNVKQGTFYPFKTRDDHRHHAIDALAVACSHAGYLQKISTLRNKEKVYRDLEELQFPEPWDTFVTDANKAINQLVISYRAQRRVITPISKTITKTANNKRAEFKAQGLAARGQLHKETVYGQRTAPGETQAYYHIRKPLENLQTGKHVEKVVDANIKQIIKNRLNEMGVDTSKPDYAIPDGVFFTIESDRKVPKLFLPNKNGPAVPILKVRMKESSSGAVQLKEGINQWVEPGNNHHIAIYQTENGELFEKVTTFWVAVERGKQGLPVIDRIPNDGSKLIASLQINDMFLLGLSEDAFEENRNNQVLLAKHLYRVQKLSAGDYSFRFHLAANLDNPNQHIRFNSLRAWIRYSPIKVVVNQLGEIHKAYAKTQPFYL